MARASNSKTGLAAWYGRLAAFNVEDLFSRKRPPGPPRTIFVNTPLPESYFDPKGKVQRQHVYQTNQVITSKYTLITFLPRNLLEQFRRVANIYFLGIAVLQFFPKFSTIAPGVVILPLIVILAITAAKDGYEDFKRHQSDRRVNNSRLRVLAGGNHLNSNVTEAKSKTFVRALLPKSRNSGKFQDVEFDSDANESEGKDSSVSRAHWKQTTWEDLRVGDFVKIMDNEQFPADILICSTSEDENVAFVETKNLDGETNLKSRQAVPALANFNNAGTCSGARFDIQCDRPDTDMYRLNATLTLDGKKSPIDLTNTLLRGTVLRNTGWVIGVVMFTGQDSKIVLNSGGTPSKRSKVERQMNPQVFVNLGILATMATVCAIADSALEKKYFPLGAPWLFGDDRSDDNPRINGIITFAFALLTFQDIVPISLYISMEVVRTCQAAFIYFDGDMYYEKTKQATMARSWNLSDDLGQIEYIFSDKTGTLTQNSMIFRMCSVGGKAYRGERRPDLLERDSDEIKDGKTLAAIDASLTTEVVEVDLWPNQNASTSQSRLVANENEEGDTKFVDEDLLEDIQASVEPGREEDAHAASLNNFFTVLALCHTVLAAIDPETGAITYKAQSPDEAALVQAAADTGYIFMGKDRETLSLRTPRSTNMEKYELLEILEFTSARKRMSVVLRHLDTEDSDLLLLTKGADNVIFERAREGDEQLKDETEGHLSEFASNGLRTLTLAYKPIPAAEYESWSSRYHEATTVLENREERIEEVANELEQDLILLGATAIEDRLQDGVPETIADLKKAGIKIWVATGDKLETAIAIGRSTNLVAHESNIIIIRGGSSRPVQVQMANALAEFFPEEDTEKPLSAMSPRVSDRPIPLRRVNTGVSSIVGADNGDRPGGFVLVLDGAALLEAFADEDNKSTLLRLAILCEAVICCRVSPLQKALIVRLVKDGLGAMTLAIGDGANDVSMIQAADVGVGISGEEGLQAVNSSDYSIAQFRFLKKLLLVHGHWSYARNGVMLLNFFYKNIVPSGVLWWFQIYNAWSANFAFDYIYILFWNSLWTIAPVVGIGLFDRFLDSHVLMEVPELYRYGREGTWYNLRSFCIYVMDGIYQSAIIYFLIHYSYFTTSARSDGYDIFQAEFSTTMAISAVLVVNIFTGINGTAWTAWLFFAVFVGIVVEWVFTAIYSLISPGYAVTRLYGNDYFLFHSAYFWLGLPITFLLALAPRFLYKAYKFGYNPGDLETFQLLQVLYPGRDLSSYSGQRPSDLAAFRNESRGSLSVVSLSGNADRFPRPSVDVRSPSHTDMATGVVSVHRGFDFATEENGVQMQRVQTNLSEMRMSKQNLGTTQTLHGKGKDTLRSLKKSLLRRKSPIKGSE
ncbi:hypothetical protein D9619_005242 [Psilocybe cf. subviscida]|uniref:Phospholipid-transporting ATPase n=1 Tax=Psilocybe cf. subviscida TaxID=2480587 RepID=A0A8H5FC50_9AGAR|nr:hypothetical protein D9619_005242 [Psilocybe cf. subviscida]